MQWHNSAAYTLTVPAMAKKADKQQASALDEVRRHVRIFVDLRRVASESTDEDGFLDQVVVQVARAVEIDHVKVLRYAAGRPTYSSPPASGGKRAL